MGKILNVEYNDSGLSNDFDDKEMEILLAKFKK